MKIGIIIQRYGDEVNGGAELHARLLAEHLAKYHDVSVLTTTALDYNTWAPYYKEGDDSLKGIKIKRFNVTFERNPLLFRLFAAFVLRIPHPVILDKLFMVLSGPYSLGLLKYIKQTKDEFDCFIVYTGCYAQSYFASLIAGEKSVFIPTAHDEPIMKLKIFDEIYRKYNYYICLTQEERDYLNKRFRIYDKPGVIIGSGIDIPENFDPNEIFKEHPELKDRNYIVFAGRLCRSKRVDVLIEYFSNYVEKTGRDLYLVLVGRQDMEIPENPRIIKLGFVSEEEKLSAIKSAKVLVNPSRFESLSLILLEAWLMETPVMINGDCEVMVGQVRRSGGGFVFKDQESFNTALDKILKNPENSRKMALSGKKYVEDNYAWETIETKINDFLARNFNK